jgi:tRNA(Ile)-lysidine synthase
MGGHSQKLSDFMINLKVPHRARAHWPIVCSGDDIVWVAGLRPANAYKITPKTKQALKLKLTKGD